MAGRWSCQGDIGRGGRPNVEDDEEIVESPDKEFSSSWKNA